MPQFWFTYQVLIELDYAFFMFFMCANSIQLNLLIVYSFSFCTFCKRLHIRILRNGNIPQASSWPQDNHKCLAIFVLLIWHDRKMVRKRAQKNTYKHSTECWEPSTSWWILRQEKMGGDGLILFSKEYNNALQLFFNCRV